MRKSSWISLAVICLSGCGPAGLEITNYQEGYNQGVREVREMRRKGEFGSEIGAKTAIAFGLRPSVESKSADWNAGYQKGISDELGQ
jgi:hypothetical protein